MSSNGGSSNGGSYTPTTNQRNQGNQAQIFSSVESARFAILMMEKTRDRLKVALEATNEGDAPPLLQDMYGHYIHVIEALTKAVNNEYTDASNGILSFEGHYAINLWENAGFASMEEAWSMRHYLDNYFQSLRV